MTAGFDVAVIGGGPAGLAAAAAAADEGASVCILEREERLGGILKQCIHDGFGLFRFDERLTGPEYAWRFETTVRDRSIEVLTGTFLTRLERRDGLFVLGTVNHAGVGEIRAVSLVAAMGCRERTDRQIFIHGERPAGVFTAGQAQDLINLKGLMPGRRCVILGSGDIGLIMARRLTLEGAEVVGVYEIGSEPSGLNRNIAQCLEDFEIPLHLNTTATQIHGKQRVEGVTVCRVDAGGKPDPDSAEYIPCDSLILSVGLIPENDILEGLGVRLDPRTGGPEVDQREQTSVPGLFSCGNALHVNDLVDHVSDSGELAGTSAAAFAAEAVRAGDRPELPGGSPPGLSLLPGDDIAYVVPQKLVPPVDGDVRIYFRCRSSLDRAVLRVEQEGKLRFRKTFRWLKPSEMEHFILDPAVLYFDGGPATFRLVQATEGGLQ